MRGMPGWQPTRLKEARLARGFSQAALAAHVNRSPATASKWENEDKDGQSPDEAVFMQLVALLRVRPSFLLKRPHDHGECALFPRELAANLKSVADRTAIRLRWLQEIALAVQEFVDLPAVNLPLVFGRAASVAPSDDPADAHKFLTLEDVDIEEAAVALRRHWKLGDGPISNVVLAMENAGIVVGYDVVGTAKLDGLSNWSCADGRPYVLLAEDKHTGTRSRMDAAHELGHISLHRHINTATQRKHHKVIEGQAWKFAAAFLLPAESFSSDLPSQITLNGLLALKDRWKISVAAMIMRCCDLGIIDADYKSQLFRNLSIRGWRKQEPLDDEVAVERPRLLRRSIELIVRENVCAALDLLETRIGLSADDVCKLASLPPNFFSDSVDDGLPLKIRDSVPEASGAVVEFPKGASRESSPAKDERNVVIYFPRK
jgi:Zn-dependent peptidase ImmA (M78 family)/transcriptional regulator with XRE-family HTH domain